MPAAGNVTAAWNNIAAAGVLTVRSEAAGMPGSNLLQEDVGRKWRGTLGDTEWAMLTYASTQPAGDYALAIFGTNLLGIATVRARLSNDVTFATSVYDSGVLAGHVDPLYGHATFVATASGVWKYLLIDLVQTGASYIEGGVIFVAPRVQFPINYAYGAQRTVLDRSTLRETEGGLTRVIMRPKSLMWDFTVEIIPEVPRWSLVEAMDQANGISTPVLFIMDPSSTNLGRDSIYGFIQESSPVVSIEGFIDGAPVYSRAYRVKARG